MTKTPENPPEPLAERFAEALANWQRARNAGSSRAARLLDTLLIQIESDAPAIIAALRTHASALAASPLTPGDGE